MGGGGGWGAGIVLQYIHGSDQPVVRLRLALHRVLCLDKKVWGYSDDIQSFI